MLHRFRHILALAVMLFAFMGTPAFAGIQPQALLAADAREQALPFLQLADKNNLSKKDGCHNSKKVGYRHYHKEGWAVAGRCYKENGVNYRVPNLDPGCESMLKWLGSERKNREGDYIHKNVFGNPVLHKDDADKLIRTCRGSGPPRGK